MTTLTELRSFARVRRLIDGLWPLLEHNARHLIFGICPDIHRTWSKPIVDATSS
jgi:hypothetical protein